MTIKTLKNGIKKAGIILGLSVILTIAAIRGCELYNYNHTEHNNQKSSYQAEEGYNEENIQESDSKEGGLEKIVEEDKQDNERRNIPAQLILNELRKSEWNEKNYLFCKVDGTKLTMPEVVKEACNIYGGDSEEITIQYIIESMLNHVKYSGGMFATVKSPADAYGLAQVLEVVAKDLNGWGIKDPEGSSWIFKRAIQDPRYNAAMGVAYLGLIDRYLENDGITPNSYNRKLAYLIGPSYAKLVLKKYGDNPKEYLDTLLNVVEKDKGKDARRQVEYYFTFTDLYKGITEQIQWPSKSFLIDIEEKKGEIEAIKIEQHNGSGVYAMLEGIVTKAGKVPNDFGNYENGTWIKIETTHPEQEKYPNYKGKLKTSYILLDEVFVHEGDYVKAGNLIGKADESFKVMQMYGELLKIDTLSLFAPQLLDETFLVAKQ